MRPAVTLSRPPFARHRGRAATSLVPVLLLAGLLAAGSACSPGGEGGGDGEAAPAAEPTRVESPEVGLALAIPADSGARVEETGPEAIRLALPPSENAPAGAQVTYRAEPPQQAGVNLVEAVNLRSQEVEARPEGDFLGQVELGGPLGAAYSTRARFREDGEPVEEIRIFAVHPAGNRLLHMTYRHTDLVAGTTQEHMSRALEAFGWIEPVAVPAGEEGGEEAGGAGAAGEATAPAP